MEYEKPLLLFQLTILLNQLCYEFCPTRLVAGSDAYSIIAMKIFVEKNAVNGSSGIWPCEEP